MHSGVLPPNANLMHFQLVAVFVPAIVTMLLLRNAWADFSRNTAVVLWSAGLSSILATPWFQKPLHVFGQPEGNLYVPPLFIALYILLGRYKYPHPGTAFAGTYLTLLLSDLVAAWVQVSNNSPWWLSFVWIGGAGLLDGLFVMPIAGALAALWIDWGLRRGHSIRILYGRERLLRQKKTDSRQ